MSRFQRPVFREAGTAATAEDLVRWSLCAEEIFHATLGERVALDYGVAIVSEAFPDLSAGNHFRDGMMPVDRRMEEMIGEVDGIFAERGRRCSGWHFSDGKIPAEAEAQLGPRGYQRQGANLWVLERPREVEERKDLTIIPGRANFEKLAELEAAREGAGTEAVQEQRRRAVVRRLDDKQVENLLALDGTEAVGMLFFVTLGGLAYIKQFYVHPGHYRQRVGSTLLMRAMELAARSCVKHLTLLCDEGNARAEALYRKAGFKVVATVRSMELPD